MLPYTHMNNSMVCWGTNNPNVNIEIRHAAWLFISPHQSVWGETRDSKKKSNFTEALDCLSVLYETSTWWSCRSAYASPQPFLPLWINYMQHFCMYKSEMKCKCFVKARHMTQPIPVFFFFLFFPPDLFPASLCTLHPHPTLLIGHGADERRNSRGR